MTSLTVLITGLPLRSIRSTIVVFFFFLLHLQPLFSASPPPPKVWIFIMYNFYYGPLVFFLGGEKSHCSLFGSVKFEYFAKLCSFHWLIFIYLMFVIIGSSNLRHLFFPNSCGKKFKLFDLNLAVLLSTWTMKINIHMIGPYHHSPSLLASNLSLSLILLCILPRKRRRRRREMLREKKKKECILLNFKQFSF